MEGNGADAESDEASRMKDVSLLMGCVGDRFLPGVKEAIAEGIKPLRASGATVDVKVQPPITVLPYFGLATMRNRLVMEAMIQGYSHLLLLDNDVILELGTLRSLVTARKGIVVPQYQADYPKRAKLGEIGERGWVTWAVFSCILFSGDALRRLGPMVFSATFCYCEEETTFQRWRLQGVTAFQAHTMVRLLRPPTNLWQLPSSEMFRLKTPGDVALASIR